MFVTIACGALSGFHALVASGTTPKLIEKESQVRFIGYGGMLTESFVAICALAAACVLDPGLYFAMNMPATALGDTVESASAAVANIGFGITPAELASAAAAVEEETLVGRTGGAPTLAVGLSQIFSEVLGGDALRAFWYHFAVMFEALFILTTVDAGTRVGRFMLQDTIGAVWPKYKDTTWKPAAWSASALVVGAWGYLLYVGVNDPLGGIYQLFPLLGIANQLLAAVTLAVCTNDADQGREGQVRPDHPGAAGVRRRRHTHGELPEDLLPGPDARLLGPASAPPGRTRRRGDQPRYRGLRGGHAAGRVQHDARHRAHRAVRGPHRDHPGRLGARVDHSSARRHAARRVEDPYVRSTIVAPAGLIPTREEKEAIRKHELAMAGSREDT